jgi:site-specific DNA-methyltransferase (adenine-specific)
MPDASVDAVVTDPPYGLTNAHWDTWATGPEWWDQVWRVTKPRGAVCLFMCGKPIVRLLREAGDWFRYKMVWDRLGRPSGFMKANIMPLRRHEDIFVFCQEMPSYRVCKEPHDGPGYGTVHHGKRRGGTLYRDTIGSGTVSVDDGTRYPIDIVRASSVGGSRLHPTQKPVPLMEKLVRWYSDEGATILDPFVGSGSTGVACVQTGRNFIGCEKDEKYVEIARRRIAEAAARPMLLEGIK